MRQTTRSKAISLRATSITLALCLFFSTLCGCGLEISQIVYAESAETGLLQGDVLNLKNSEWEDSYIILEPDRMSNKKPGTFMLKKDIDETVAFNFDRTGDEYLEVANIWEGSLAQIWCMFYYRRLPQNVKDAVVGVKSNETESGTDWAGVNNIDGTRLGDTDYDKDKAFFLSFIEYDSHMNIPGVINGEKWHLRAPYTCGDLAVYVCVVDETGRVMNYGYTEKLGARPALNMDLSKLENASKCRHGEQVTWVLDATEQNSGFTNTQYIWSDDNSQCTATGVCNNCGEEISETVAATSVVTREATIQSEGELTYVADFSGEYFETQNRTEVIGKLTAPVLAEQRPVEILDSSLPKLKAKSLKLLKKSLSTKWKKISKNKQKKIQGIEIQCAADKAFSNIISSKDVKKTKASVKITKLERKRNYWIRMRTYKYVDGIKYVSAWSKAKKGRTK